MIIVSDSEGVDTDLSDDDVALRENLVPQSPPSSQSTLPKVNSTYLFRVIGLSL